MAQLYFRYGAMGCGKTMQLLQVAFNYEERGQHVCVIKPATDTKNGSKLLTRIGPERQTDFCFDRRTNLFSHIKRDFANVNCVLVDEAQFLTPKQADQLMEVVVKLDIPVICFGLRLNFRLKDGGFEGSTRLLQIAHKIEEIKTICQCGDGAIHNVRFNKEHEIVLEGEQVVIDGAGDDTYESMCRNCRKKLVREKKRVNFS